MRWPILPILCPQTLQREQIGRRQHCLRFDPYRYSHAHLRKLKQQSNRHVHR